MKVIMFGAGASAHVLYEEISKQHTVVAFADNDEGKWGKSIRNVTIYPPKECLSGMAYDAVVISAFCGLEEIRQQCLEMGVPQEKIITSFFESSRESRQVFLKNLAELLADRGQPGDVAEAGVYRGEFAQWINLYFPDRTLHLFDTFEGFDPRDLCVEKERGFSQEAAGHFCETSVELVLGRMPYPENCRVHKGYFPDTARDLEQRFCFVNLDLDLYLPIYHGLHLLKDKMTPEGVILVHDYFASGYKGARAAVDQFLSECGGTIHGYPIGDNASILLVGQWN